MAWVKVDDRLPKGPKVKRAALRLGGRLPRRRILAVWLQAMCYCNAHATDGFVPDYEVSEIEDEKPADVFTAMAHGDETLGAIVERDNDRAGWLFRNYDEYQPTKAQIDKKRKADRKRQQRARLSRKRPSGVTHLSQRDAPSVTRVSVTPSPALPGPSQPHEDQDQKPRADAPDSLAMMADTQSHLKAACHTLIEANPNIDDGDLAEHLKLIAARHLRVGDYNGRSITRIVDAVRGARARRSA